MKDNSVTIAVHTFDNGSICCPIQIGDTTISELGIYKIDDVAYWIVKAQPKPQEWCNCSSGVCIPSLDKKYCANCGRNIQPPKVSPPVAESKPVEWVDTKYHFIIQTDSDMALKQLQVAVRQLQQQLQKMREER